VATATQEGRFDEKSIDMGVAIIARRCKSGRDNSHTGPNARESNHHVSGRNDQHRVSSRVVTRTGT